MKWFFNKLDWTIVNVAAETYFTLYSTHHRKLGECDSVYFYGPRSEQAQRPCHVVFMDTQEQCIGFLKRLAVELDACDLSVLAALSRGEPTIKE